MSCVSLQAQTVANFFLAFDQNLAIVPVLNKIDMVSAEPDKVAEEMKQVIMHATSLLMLWLIPERLCSAAELAFACALKLEVLLSTLPLYFMGLSSETLFATCPQRPCSAAELIFACALQSKVLLSTLPLLQKHYMRHALADWWMLRLVLMF